MSVKWSYYDKYESLIDKYMPSYGEGETKASQIVTAVNKLVYKWYNDGDVFDNTYDMRGWANDLSDYANWLYENTDAKYILKGIADCEFCEEYAELLKNLADHLFDEEFLEEQNKIEKVGTIYDCKDIFKFKDGYEDEDEDEYEDEYDYWTGIGW